METYRKGTNRARKPAAWLVAAALAALCSSLLAAQSAEVAANPPAAAPEPVRTASVPPPNSGFFPLSQVRRGLMATAWTVFEGTTPEPMQVEILGILRGARGPGQDLILAQLKGAKAEYTGVVDGMSGSPVYIGNKLVGSISYRIGVFTKDPIAGITPIEQMLEVQKMPISDLTPVDAETALLEKNPLSGSDSPASGPGIGRFQRCGEFAFRREYDLSAAGDSADHEWICACGDPLLAAADRGYRAATGGRWRSAAWRGGIRVRFVRARQHRCRGFTFTRSGARFA